jgi:hypothetical protein
LINNYESGEYDMPLQIRRGTNNQRQNMAAPLAPGELLYTTDTERMYVGNGTTLGGNLISGFTDSNAKDAAAEMIVNGTHQRISFIYDEDNQTLNAVVDTSVDEGPLVADAFVGSVFADDSTLLVDAVEGRIVGPVFSNVTGNVVGDVTGSVVGNVVGDLTGSVFADDSSLIISGIDKSLSINAIDSTSSAIEVGTKFIFNSGTSESVVLDQISNDILSDSVLFRKARGSVGNLQAVTNNDVLSSINFLGHDGSNYAVSAKITATVDGTVSASNVPSKITFFIENRLGDFSNPLEIGSSSDDARSLLKLIRQRGSVNSPLPVESGDIAHEIAFQSYDGEKYLDHARISVQVSGPTAINNIPTIFSVDVLHPSGEFVRPLELTSAGTINIYKRFYDGALLRIFQNHETQDSANIEFFRSRGLGGVESSILASDDIIDLAFLGYYNGAYRASAGLKVKAVSFSGNRVLSTVALAMDNGAAFAERFVLDSSGTIDFKQTALVAGSNPGEVDTSAPVTYMRVKLNGVEYAMPLFAINT